MNLTVEQYKYYRLELGLTDKEILKKHNYSTSSIKTLLKWKRRNNVPIGKNKCKLLDKTHIKKQLQTMSATRVAIENGVHPEAFYTWAHSLLQEEK